MPFKGGGIPTAEDITPTQDMRQELIRVSLIASTSSSSSVSAARLLWLNEPILPLLPARLDKRQGVTPISLYAAFSLFQSRNEPEGRV
jgi:hypothetical protein